MIIKILAIILFVIFLFPFGLGISAGLNRTLKIGISITLLGICITLLTEHFYPSFLVPYSGNIEAYDHGLFMRRWLLVGMNIGLAITTIGGFITYAASVIQAWKKRQILLPFLFDRGE